MKRVLEQGMYIFSGLYHSSEDVCKVDEHVNFGAYLVRCHRLKMLYTDMQKNEGLGSFFFFSLSNANGKMPPKSVGSLKKIKLLPQSYFLCFVFTENS